MPSYRFCRPDDLPLLVRALNECFFVHFPDQPEMTVEVIRREMKELDVWPSNSMVALVEGETRHPLAVVLGTKRDDEVLIHRLGSRPGHERQGHGGHLVTSLSQKLAVLGPPRLVAELPESLADREPFFLSQGFTPEEVLTDYARPADAPWPVASPPEGLVVPVTVAELEGAEALHGGLAWERRVETLQGRGERLQGRMIASPESLEAWMLYDPDHGDVWGLGCRNPDRRTTLLAALFRAVEEAIGRPLRFPRLAPGEVASDILDVCGFVAGATTRRYGAEATPL